VKAERGGHRLLSVVQPTGGLTTPNPPLYEVLGAESMRFWADPCRHGLGRMSGRSSGTIASARGVACQVVVRRKSLKVYDKFGARLRCETTINGDGSVYRTTEVDPTASQAWREN